jgi:hypothetical protein
MRYLTKNIGEMIVIDNDTRLVFLSASNGSVTFGLLKKEELNQLNTFEEMNKLIKDNLSMRNL